MEIALAVFLVLLIGLTLVGGRLVKLALERSEDELGTQQQSGGAIDSGKTGAEVSVMRSARPRTDRLRGYHVTIDGHKAGILRAGEQLSLTIAPGEHLVRVTMDWVGSDRARVNIKRGQCVWLSCEPRATPWTLVYWLTLGHSRYIRLAATDSRSVDG
jgi:hypothetical protein